MDRLRQLWVESGKSWEQSSARPPPLRTSCTYDDDEAFNNVALNLLSRYESLGLSAKEALLSTLISPKQRASFFEGLCVRLDRSQHFSPVTESLLQSIQTKFGKELKDMVEKEGQEGDHRPCYSMKPPTPRATTTNNSQVSSHGGQPTIPTTVRNSHHNEKKQFTRMFFPDSSGSKGSGAFFRKRRVQNIDWKLAQAVQCVESLRLDGDTTPRHGGSYEPPAAH